MGIRRFMHPSLFALAGIAAGLSLHAQSTGAAAPLQFEVASLKQTVDPMAMGVIKRMPGDRGYFGTNMPLFSYLSVAYQVRHSLISGPDILNEHYDLDAKAERPSTPDELHVMLQHLLEERFHMKLRRETKDQAGYVLVVDKGGPKFGVHAPDGPPLMPIPSGSGKHNASNATMGYFAYYLSNELDRTVVDKTGLDGNYDFQVEWYMQPTGTAIPIAPGPPGTSPMTNMPPGAAMPMEMREAQMPTGPTLFDALKKQLGLRLDAAQVPVEHLVVEHIEKLTEN
jgi:uncharacterized protein (TIGR03435 family)